jgi:thiol-disulfide isomerase/thioredoxin
LLPGSANSAEAQLQPWHEDERVYGFSLPDIYDETHSLADYKGKVVLINFWASWCPPCIYEMPALTRLKQSLKDQPFEILAINVGEKKYKVRKFTKLINFYLPVLLDTKKVTFNTWGVKTLPTSFLIDANGNVRYQVRGDPNWDNENTIAVINSLILEQTTTDLQNEARQ